MDLHLSGKRFDEDELASGGARVFAARGKRLRCHPL